MFTPIIRILLIIAAIVIAVLNYSKGDYVNVAMLAFAVVLLIYGHYKYGTVYAAFQQLRKQNYKKAEKLLSKIKDPEKLRKSHKSYYHFTKGFIDLDKQELDASFSELSKALNIGLRTQNDTAIVLLNLGAIEFERKNYKKAKEYALQSKEFDVKPIVTTEIEKLLKQIQEEEEESTDG